MKKRKINKRLGIIMLFVCIAILTITDRVVKPFSKAEERTKAQIASISSNVFSGGDGTESTPYVITTAEQLQILAQKINTYSEDSENGGYYKNKYYILNNDIDFSGKEWIVIGTCDSLELEDCTTKYSFQGKFDGNGHVIKNVTYEISKIPNKRGAYGIFGMLWGDGTNNASIYNLGIDNMNVTLTASGESKREISIGTMAGQLGKNSSIRNCIVTNSRITINPEGQENLFYLGSAIKLSIGGLVGDTASNASGNSTAWEEFEITDDYGIQNCYVDVDITSRDEEVLNEDQTGIWYKDNNTYGTRYNRYTIGGIVGTLCFANKFPQNCVYEGTIKSTKAFVGPIYGKGEFISLTRANYPKLFASIGNNDASEFKNYYYNYKVVNSEITPSEYSFDGEYENTVSESGVELHPITSTKTLMAYVQGVNRGTYVASLSNVVSEDILNSLSKNDKKYQRMNYDSINQTISFEAKTEVAIQRENYTFSAELKNSEQYNDADLAYKWLILKENDENWEEINQNEKQITIHPSLIKRKLKVNVYSNNELICTDIVVISNETVDVKLEKVRDGENYALQVVVNASNGDTTDNFTYKWYSREDETGEYTLIENENSYIYKYIDMPEGTYIKVIVKSTTFQEEFTQELEFINLNAVFVDQTNGDDSNDGKTKDQAFASVRRAYVELSDKKNAKDNIIVIIGEYNDWANSNQLASESNILTKPATICGLYLGVNYNSTFKLSGHTYLHADTIFRNITLTTNQNAFLYTQGNDLTMEDSVEFGSGFNMLYNTAFYWGIQDIDGYMNLKRLTIVGGTKNYSQSKFGNVKQRISNITIRCSGIAVITGGSRTEGATTAEAYGTVDNPANVNITIDIKNSSNSIDVGLLVGGQCDSSSYMNTEINVNNGKIARIVGGTLGYGNAFVGVPKDTFYGSTILNINGGTIKEIYGGPLGRNDKTSYMYGRVDLNINGGTIEGNVYGAGAGGTLGYSEKYFDRLTDEFKSDSIYSPAGKTMKKLLPDGTTEDISLEDSVVNININGGTINGNVYGGGYGESAYLTADQIADDGGTLYGDVNLSITGGIINGNAYGGGKGSSKYGEKKTQLAQIYGNIVVRLTDNANITGNIFGGSEGITEYPDIGKITGSITLTINGKNVSVGGTNIMGSGNAGDIKGIVKVEIINANLTSNIFGGGLGETAIVTPLDDDKKSILVSIKNSKIIGDVYAGGDLGDVFGNVALFIGEDSQIIGSVYGGGNNANVGSTDNNADTYVQVANAIIGNIQGRDSSDITGGEIFGGGNNGVVYGNTNIEVGSKNSQIKTVVENQMYAGGRGKEGVTTVTGTSNGQIIGINTSVGQYGSSSLGKVDGEVNITFDSYRTHNNLDKYKVMSGINKATNLYLVDSYVYLTTGLMNIENLYIPKNSGMLISENSSIEGDFIGGGELYLQSGVTLTIKKDIRDESEQTTLTINPRIITDSGYFEIAGGEERPYIVVLGTDYYASKNNIGIVSGNKAKYEIKNKTDVDYQIDEDSAQKASIYYIEQSIQIASYVNEKISNEEGRIFSKTINNENDVYILENGAVTSQIGINYNMIRNKDKDDTWKLVNDTEMKNLRRFVYMTGTKGAVKLPAGTVITMIVDDNYYTYKIPENYGTEEFWKDIYQDSKYLDLGDTVENLENEIPLSLFSDSNGNLFKEDKNIQEKIDINNETTSNICTVTENYKFIIDFANGFGLNEEEINDLKGSHEMVFNIIDYKQDEENNTVKDEIYKDKTDLNEICINYRNYKLEYYENNLNITKQGCITTNIVFSADEISALNSSDIGKKVILKITLNNLASGEGAVQEIVSIPEGTVVTINGRVYDVENYEILYELIDSLNIDEYNENIELKLDMSSVEEAEKLAISGCVLKVEAYISEKIDENNVLIDNVVAQCEQQVQMTNAGKYGIMVNVSNYESDTTNNIPAQIITEEGATRTVNITYQIGNLGEKTYIQAKTYKKDSDGKYNEYTKNLVNESDIAVKSLSRNLFQKNANNVAQTITSEITFEKNMEKGTYRIEYSLCDEDGNEVVTDFVNFIVK